MSVCMLGSRNRARSSGLVKAIRMKHIAVCLVGLPILPASCGGLGTTPVGSTVPAEPAAPEQAVALYPILQGDKWGYMDGTGTVVIPPQFPDANYFYAGLAAVRKDLQWGYLD